MVSAAVWTAQADLCVFIGCSNKLIQLLINVFVSYQNAKYIQTSAICEAQTVQK